MTVPSSRKIYASRFGLPLDLRGAQRYLKENPHMLEQKPLYVCLYNSVEDNDVSWVKMIVTQGKNHLPLERRSGMLSFAGWLQSAITNEHDQLIDYLLQEFLSHGVDEPNFEDLLLHSISCNEHTVVDALLAENTQHLNCDYVYFEACCAAMEYENNEMYTKILPLVSPHDWPELELFLEGRKSLERELQAFLIHKCAVQRKTLLQETIGGTDDVARKM